MVRAIQELRDKKKGPVAVGIGGPCGSGKSSLASKVGAVFGGAVIAMEHYQDPSIAADDSKELDLLDFSLLRKNLEGLLQGNDIAMPQFDFQQKKRLGYKVVAAPESGVVIVEGTYALNERLRPYLDLKVAVVGGVHYNLISKVHRDIGETTPIDQLIDGIFPSFRQHIEPDLQHAQISISNSFKSSLREPFYILKMYKEQIKKPIDAFYDSQMRYERSLEIYLRPPYTMDQGQTTEWIKMRQCGIRYDAGWGDQRIVDKQFIIKPRVEFEVGKETLGGLLALGYQVAVSYKRESECFDNGSISICIETVDDLDRCFVLVRGKDRKVVAAQASSLGMEGPWITKSYLELVLDKKGLPRLGSPPLPTSAFQGPISPRLPKTADNMITAPRPLHLKPLNQLKTPDAPEPWTRSPTKSEMDSPPVSWRLASAESGTGKDEALKAKIQLQPIPEALDFDRGLLLGIQGIQTLLNAKGSPVIVGIGGPSGSGKTSLAYKMANIMGCEVISLENYYRSEQVRDFKYDDFSSLDLPLLLKNIREIRSRSVAMVPLFDFEKNIRSAFKTVEVSKDCGVVIIEGVYALHPSIRNLLDFWIAVVGGVHSHLIARVQRDLERSQGPLLPEDIMRTLFPMFQQHIEPHIVHAHLKIRNDFDPVHSPDSSLFVLKSSKEVSVKDIAKILDPEQVSSTVLHFTDIYLHLPGAPSTETFTEGNCIRVRNCEGRFALLIREPIREGNFIIQPKVDFDISVRTVAGLLNLGYQATAYLEAKATIYQDEKLIVEVDHLKHMETPFLQIKGSDKEAVAAAGIALNLDGTYTTMPYIEIVLGNKFSRVEGFAGLHDPEASELRKWVDFVQSQAGSSGSDDIASPIVPMEFLLEELQIRIKKLERWNRWHILNSVLWTFFMSAFVGYVLYQRKRRPA
ncbi:hypothetical protein GOP47_0009327 [Adiantum capillus-veneris]|uniref:AAA+ ATPase domain-containing protein n=1 Tax=Adiantum capillus-veneris TaxID=13818 RepID=A0A9D4ZJE9_ADICA|nr:hypothetical protein GOP47_0009327 [Adiantum capillus-veneris]